MVMPAKKKAKTLKVCMHCGMKYNDLKWWKACEAWCVKHPSCNLEVIRHAVK